MWVEFLLLASGIYEAYGGRSLDPGRVWETYSTSTPTGVSAIIN